MRKPGILNQISRFLKKESGFIETVQKNKPQALNNSQYKKPYTVGLFYPEQSVFLIRNPQHDISHRFFEFAYPAAKWLPITGKWDKSGIMGCGLYDSETSLFILRNKDDSGYPDITVYFGTGGAGWLPLVGDWNGEGQDRVGLYDPLLSQFYLNTTGQGGAADYHFTFGVPGRRCYPLSGDWSGQGKTGIGVYDAVDCVFYLRNSLTEGPAEYVLDYENKKSGLLPISGDWNNDGRSGVGLYDPSTSCFSLFDLDQDKTQATKITFGLNNLYGLPVALVWNGWGYSNIKEDEVMAERLGLVG